MVAHAGHCDMMCRLLAVAPFGVNLEPEMSVDIWPM